jgi:hypothetical protein
MFSPHSIMSILSTKRALFHSEADFQHSFAWEIHHYFPNSQIRLELPWGDKDKKNHLDVFTVVENENIAIELKYKTRGLSVAVNQEIYVLKDQSAQDIGRYDFLKDIMRLEELSRQNNWIGFGILLTNDSSYWKVPITSNTVDADFRLHQNRLIQGDLQWGEKASPGTIDTRESPIVLRKSYLADWIDYSRPSLSSYGQFRYLIFRV